jgi:hypothetical protein
VRLAHVTRIDPGRTKEMEIGERHSGRAGFVGSKSEKAVTGCELAQLKAMWAEPDQRDRDGRPGSTGGLGEWQSAEGESGA